MTVYPRTTHLVSSLGWTVLGLLLCVPPALFAGTAQKGGKRRSGRPTRLERGPSDDLSSILRGLENGRMALDALGKVEESRRLAEIAAELRAGMHKPGPPPRKRSDVEVLELGIEVLIENTEATLAKVLERKLRALDGSTAGGDAPSDTELGFALEKASAYLHQDLRLDEANAMRAFRNRIRSGEPERLVAPEDDDPLARISALEEKIESMDASLQTVLEELRRLQQDR